LVLQGRVNVQRKKRVQVGDPQRSISERGLCGRIGEKRLTCIILRCKGLAKSKKRKETKQLSHELVFHLGRKIQKIESLEKQDLNTTGR